MPKINNDILNDLLDEDEPLPGEREENEIIHGWKDIYEDDIQTDLLGSLINDDDLQDIWFLSLKGYSMKSAPGVNAMDCTFNDGTVIHFEHGLIHCADGPAIIKPNGDKYYFKYGRRLSKTEFDFFGALT